MSVLDTIIETPEIMARAKTVTEAYDKFITYAHKYHLNGKGNQKELKRLLYLRFHLLVLEKQMILQMQCFF